MNLTPLLEYGMPVWLDHAARATFVETLNLQARPLPRPGLFGRTLILIAVLVGGCGSSTSADLGASLPHLLAGASVAPVVASGDGALQGTVPSAAVIKSVRDLTARLGKTPADVSTAYVVMTGNVVMAIRIAGVDSGALVSTYEKLTTEAIAGLTLSDLKLGGKSVREEVYPGSPTHLLL